MPKAFGHRHHKLEVSDFATLRQEARDAVRLELGAMLRPDDRLQRAAEIIRQADLEIAAHAEDRNKTAASLWFYDGTRGLAKVMGLAANAYRIALYQSLYGIDPRSWKQGDPFPAELPTAQGERAEDLAKVAEEAGLPRQDTEEASSRLPELSRIVAAASERRTTALKFMQDAELALFEYGWSADRIAAHAGVRADLVKKHCASARKRRGY